MVHNYLEDIVQTGIYGKTISEAADRLLAQAIQQLLTANVIKSRSCLKIGD